MAKNQNNPVAPATKKTGAEAKKDALATALAQIEKQFGKGAVMKLGDNAAMQVDAVSTGSLGLDMALGVGGVPRGRIIEVYGPESSGKTTLALHVLAEAQKKGGEVAFIDVEHALDPVYAEALGASEEQRLRALALANLISVHQKKYIGSLSAYCGAVSAATGAACGVAYLKLKGKISEEALYQVMSDTITNSICTIGGMVCDGAKSSCAAKIAAALESAFTGLEMSLKQRVFQPGEGLTMDSVEDTIAAVGRMGRVGMKSTDVEILNIMLGH